MTPASANLSSTVGRTSLSLGMSPGLNNPIVLKEGWILKKRRKKMQGFARRYFVLTQSGILCYSFESGQPVRDQVSLHNSAISTAPGRKDVHIDSNKATFHLKCLSTEDFNEWMSAFRRFGPTADARRSASMRVALRPGTVRLNKSGSIAEEMGATITELEEAVAALQKDTRRPTSLNRSKSDKDKKFGLFKRSAYPGEFGMELDNDMTIRIEASLDSLKKQHVALLKSLQSLSIDTNSIAASPLPRTSEGDESFRIPSLIRRSSIATTVTESVNEWFDASDGPEEFILDQATLEPSQITTNDSQSSLSRNGEESSDIDTDIEEDDESIFQNSSPAVVVRRNQLPALPAGDEGSLFAILKKNVGKDLSTIAFPVTFNEPLTLLQRSAEELEYHDLLDHAAAAPDPIERMRYVAAFAVSQYCHTRHRSGRKGFNPMLAETFEDPRMKFIAEKVRHNPLEMAYHAEGKGWELYATSSGKTKFWGKSLEIIPLGTTHLKIGSGHYQWKKPSSFMRNIMVGTKYLEHCGRMDIENVEDDTRCVLEFKPSGYFAPSNVVSGAIHDASGEIVSTMEGKWDDSFAESMNSSYFRVLWRATPWPKSTHEYYGFTAFTITLNEITSDLVGKLPPTDSRFRPDVRALEEGDLDTAEEEKVRVEEMQRARRRNNAECQPRWFKQVGEEWEYIGGYWEARTRCWKGSDKIQALW